MSTVGAAELNFNDPAAEAAIKTVAGQPANLNRRLAASRGRLRSAQSGCATPSFGSATNFGIGNQTFSVVVGDFNLDSKPDLATANQGSHDVSVLLGNGAGGFGAATNFGVGTAPASVALGDFNLDGKLDFATVNQGSNNVSVRLGNGAGGFGAVVNFGVASEPVSVASGDLNLDGKPDLAIANNGSHNVSLLLGDGLGGFGIATHFNVGLNPQAVALGDFNLDGKPDLAAANIGSNNVSVLLGDGVGGFGAASNFDVGESPVSVAVGDFNLDSKTDLVVANIDSSNISLLLGNGVGGFGAATNVGVSFSPTAVAVGDFNLDGKSDLVTAIFGPHDVMIMLGNGAGGFGLSTPLGLGIAPRSVAVGDFNLDGKPDLVTASFAFGIASVMLNNCAANTPPTITASGVTRTAGNPSANSLIALATDIEDTENSLQIQISNGASFGAQATLNGVTVTLTDQNLGAPNINPDPVGQVFANIIAACDATAAATFTLRSTDNNGSVMETAFTVAVTPNPPPTLSYATQTVPIATTPVFLPATGPADNGGVTAIKLQSITPATGLTLSVDNLTGQVTVTNAMALGSYTVVIRATDNCTPAAVSDASFIVNVECPAITLNPAAPPNGQTGQPYAHGFTQTGAIGSSLNWSLGVGTLPPGLVLNASTGQLSGTPTQNGAFNFTIRLTDSFGCTGAQSFTVNIACGPITLNPLTLPSAQVGVAYNQVLGATGGSTPYTFTLATGSSLPPGLTLAANGVLSGTPMTAGSVTFTVNANDANNCGGNRPYTLVVACPMVALNPATLPSGVQGTTYNQSVTASPAGGNYSYAVTGNALPPGLTLNAATGAITGMPNAAGNYSFVITATGFGGCAGSRSYNLLIAPGICRPILLTGPAILPEGTHGLTYSQTLSASGGVGPYSFGVVNGALPDGLTLNPSGLVSGTPSAPGTFLVTVQAKDVRGCTGQRVYVLLINCGTVTINPETLPNPMKGVAYSQALTASPAGEYTFDILMGRLPPGLTLSRAGRLSGVTSQNGTYTFTVSARTVRGCRGTRSYTLFVTRP